MLWVFFLKNSNRYSSVKFHLMTLNKTFSALMSWSSQTRSKSPRRPPRPVCIDIDLHPLLKPLGTVINILSILLYNLVVTHECINISSILQYIHVPHCYLRLYQCFIDTSIHTPLLHTTVSMFYRYFSPYDISLHPSSSLTPFPRCHPSSSSFRSWRKKRLLQESLRYNHTLLSHWLESLSKSL